MSTSILYHCFGIRGPFKHCSTEFTCGRTTFHITHNPRFKCPICRSFNVVKKGTKKRCFIATPIGERPTYIQIQNQRVYCNSCSTLNYLPLNFIPRSKVRHTKGFESYVLSLSKLNITISAIAKLCNVSWDTIKDIQKTNLQKKYLTPSLTDVTHIGIDEIYCGAKSGFMTVVIDLKTSAVVYTEKGKKAESLSGFWQQKQRCKKPIKAVATDMGRAYISSVKQHAPNALLVIDRFHVVKRFNEKLTEYRRQLQSEMSDKLEAQALKNTRWLLVSNPENLNENGQTKLERALEVNRPLATVYYLKADESPQIHVVEI